MIGITPGDRSLVAQRCEAVTGSGVIRPSVGQIRSTGTPRLPAGIDATQAY